MPFTAWKGSVGGGWSRQFDPQTSSFKTPLSPDEIIEIINTLSISREISRRSIADNNYSLISNLVKVSFKKTEKELSEEQKEGLTRVYQALLAVPGIDVKKNESLKYIRGFMSSNGIKIPNKKYPWSSEESSKSPTASYVGVAGAGAGRSLSEGDYEHGGKFAPSAPPLEDHSEKREGGAWGGPRVVEGVDHALADKSEFAPKAPLKSDGLASDVREGGLEPIYVKTFYHGESGLERDRDVKLALRPDLNMNIINAIIDAYRISPNNPDLKFQMGFLLNKIDKDVAQSIHNIVGKEFWNNRLIRSAAEMGSREASLSLLLKEFTRGTVGDIVEYVKYTEDGKSYNNRGIWLRAITGIGVEDFFEKGLFGKHSVVAQKPKYIVNRFMVANVKMIKENHFSKEDVLNYHQIIDVIRFLGQPDMAERRIALDDSTLIADLVKIGVDNHIIADEELVDIFRELLNVYSINKEKNSSLKEIAQIIKAKLIKETEDGKDFIDIPPNLTEAFVKLKVGKIANRNISGFETPVLVGSTVLDRINRSRLGAGASLLTPDGEEVVDDNSAAPASEGLEGGLFPEGEEGERAFFPAPEEVYVGHLAGAPSAPPLEVDVDGFIPGFSPDVVDQVPSKEDAISSVEGVSEQVYVDNPFSPVKVGDQSGLEFGIGAVSTTTTPSGGAATGVVGGLLSPERLAMARRNKDSSVGVVDATLSPPELPPGEKVLSSGRALLARRRIPASATTPPQSPPVVAGEGAPRKILLYCH